ncbi:EAL domain-containing protein [Alishewanella sp. SMS8]|uniref:EAL domain-containing response regulator n=1 Tax=Alishewanella sp. SMS8 TaxID=2994676 RepID=UPI002740DBC7|nr:EAL domain-containing protein [Alishewanella sp. SMS8]MDP4946007.1 EAL domain-containing protein [Alishewanella sp.]MDP5035362.1 EAL domain-containing protein [Alishewanella sp.]MDP5188184.1 EAL domain-containing protein [Alishewanella sp.]MDP5458019.1 EAL domain-containing protein [Alishewanella sp. SMS8]
MPNKLLLVDDEQAILRALTRLFKRAGYSVFSADSAAGALAIMHQEACQVVITDFRMPVMDGAALLAELKIHYPSSLCIVLSGFADFNSVLALLNAGSAFRFLQKPWEEKTLLEEVNNAFVIYNERRYNTLVNQLMSSSADSLIEITNTGRLVRVNGVAKQALNLDEVQGLTLSMLLPTATEQEIAQLLESHTGHGMFKTTSGKDVEIFVKVVDKLSRVLQLILHADPFSTIFLGANSSVVMDQKAILRSADALLDSNHPFALVAIRLKNYEYWSEMIGFSEAEKLANAISVTLLEQTKSLAAQLGQLANEQYILVLDNISSELDVHKKLTVLIQSFQLPDFFKSAVRVEFAVSYCIAPDDGKESRQLLNNVLISNRLLINSNSNFFMRYDASMIERKREQLLISEALFYAIENNQLYLNYQPKFDLLQHKVTSCEALLRWQHPTLGFVSPAVFIPVAEQEGQIVEVGYWVLQRVCQMLVNLQQQGVQLDKIAINISGKQLSQDDFITRVESILSNFDIDASLLEFELTESWLVENMEKSVEKLNRLKASGITIAIDDFGTGYSSLSYLSKLPIDVIKIDRSLITDIAQNLNTQSMVANITRMAHDMKMQVVVEGVETLEQLLMLRQLKCDVIQGFLIAKPQPEDNFVNILAVARTEISSLLGAL